MTRRTLQLLCVTGLTCMPLAAAAHLLDGSPDPMPTWVPIAGLIIAGVMGGTIGFVINRHRQSMELKKKERLQRAAEAGGSPAKASPPPESVP
jgi:hypothetical protein